MHNQQPVVHQVISQQPQSKNKWSIFQAFCCGAKSSSNKSVQSLPSSPNPLSKSPQLQQLHVQQAQGVEIQSSNVTLERQPLAASQSQMNLPQQSHFSVQHANNQMSRLNHQSNQSNRSGGSDSDSYEAMMPEQRQELNYAAQRQSQMRLQQQSQLPQVQVQQRQRQSQQQQQSSFAPSNNNNHGGSRNQQVGGANNHSEQPVHGRQASMVVASSAGSGGIPSIALQNPQGSGSGFISQNNHRRAQSHNIIHGNMMRAIHEVSNEVMETQNSEVSVHSYSSPQPHRINSLHPQQHLQQSSQQPRYFTMVNEFFKLKTKYAIHEIDFVDCRPTDTTFQSYFNYDCPICYRHFNRILKSDCCENYLCHYCLRDAYNKSREKSNYEYHCMFCQLPMPSYVDVEELDQVKRYTDSPFMIITPKDNTKVGVDQKGMVVPFTTATGVATTTTGHNIHNNRLIEFQDESMDKENMDSRQNEVSICSNVAGRNKPSLNSRHVAVPVDDERSNKLQQHQQQQRGEVAYLSRERTVSISDNENVHQSAHKPAGLIPEFQNKYHCNYLQQNKVNGISIGSAAFNSQRSLR